jgi:hypothetical protein
MNKKTQQRQSDIQLVNSRFIQLFESEWKKRSKMHFDWEWVEDAGCVNKTECRRMIKSILKQLKNGC